MTDIILSGCGGKMGKNIADCVNGRDDCRIIAGIDLKADENSPFPICLLYTSDAADER